MIKIDDGGRTMHRKAAIYHRNDGLSTRDCQYSMSLSASLRVVVTQ